MRDRQTDHATSVTIGRIFVRSTTMRPNNTNKDDIYGAVVVAIHCEGAPGSSDECRLHVRQVAANSPTNSVNSGCRQTRDGGWSTFHSPAQADPPDAEPSPTHPAMNRSYFDPTYAAGINNTSPTQRYDMTRGKLYCIINIIKPHRSTVGLSVCLFVCLSVCRSVGLSVMITNTAKTAEPIDLQFGMWTRVGPRNCVLDGSRSPREGTFEEDDADHRSQWLRLRNFPACCGSVGLFWLADRRITRVPH